MKGRVGAVVGVTVAEDENSVYVDVSIGPEKTFNDIEYRTEASGIYVVPEFGDIVEVETLGNGRAIAHSSQSRRDESLPAGLSEGDIAIKLNDNTVLHFRKDGDVYDVDMECDGKLHLDASSIEVGENGEAVATASHTHDYEDELADGTTATKTTDLPDDTTYTVIE